MGRSIIHPVYSNPPVLPSPDAATASHWPASVILDNSVYVADRRNATTATATSRDGYQVQVSFCIAEAPTISYSCLHSPSPKPKYDDLFTVPFIVGAEGAFVLLRLEFIGSGEYFIYKAGPGSPSLERVQDPDEYNPRIIGLTLLGIVPCGEGGDYLLAGLRYLCTHYELYIYSSITQKWSKKLLELLPGVNAVQHEKVIYLGEGLLGWVDLWHGILLFNVHDQHPKIRYIPLPEPLPLNKKYLRSSNRRQGCPWLLRDLTVSNGVIKFFEMERRARVIQVTPEMPEKPSDPSEKDVLLDSDLILPASMDKVPKKKKKKPSFVYDGWRAVTWNRTISSNCWIKGHLVDVDDILINNSEREMLLSMLRGKGLGALTFRDLYSASPNLSMNGGDIVYIKTKVNLEDPNGWVVAIDLGKKTLEALAPYSLGRHSPFSQIFLPITLSNHLNVSPGLENTAFCQITQAGCLENGPNKTTIRAGESNTSASENKRPRLSPERVSHAHNGAQSVKRNVHLPSASVPQPLDPLLNIGLQQPACFQMTQTGFSESDTNKSTIHLRESDPRATENKVRRLSAEEVNRNRQNFNLSWGSLQKNPPPGQRLNNQDEASQHGYERRYGDSYCLAPNIHAYGTPPGYGNYQENWQQPPPFQQSSAYGAWHEPPPLQ